LSRAVDLLSTLKLKAPEIEKDEKEKRGRTMFKVL
jgi:hypothetical protein